MDWFRSYHGAPSDTKLSLVAIKSGQCRAFVTAVWWEVLDHASRTVTQGHARGDVSNIDPEIIAHQQGLQPEQVVAILDAMRGKGMIADGLVANWDKYQVRREDPQATVRKQQQRRRDRALSDDTDALSRTVTQGHALSLPDKRRGEEIREDTSAPTGAADDDSARAVLWQLCRAYLGEKKMSLVGKWAKQHDEQTIYDAVVRAQKAEAADPVAFIQKILDPPAWKDRPQNCMPSPAGG